MLAMQNCSVASGELEQAKRPLRILLANPRGFCAGVDRAILMVERALQKFGSPVYVRHEIVHNNYVVAELVKKGAIFVQELHEIPIGTTAPVIFSAHGVPKSVPEAAQHLNLHYLDATCPLVSKVHREAERHFKNGLHIILIGHTGHPEVIGTMGQLPDGAITLIETSDDAEKIMPGDTTQLAYVTQTTLSLDDTREIIEILERRFPAIVGPFKEDICYATTNRQNAVKVMGDQIDAMIVLGAPNSSNSNRLVEVAVRQGAKKAMLLERAHDLDLTWLDGVQTLGITAGASAPEILVNEVIEKLQQTFVTSIETISITEENVVFKLPRILNEVA